MSESKSSKCGKYDVDLIGQRKVGRGMNVYSLQRERAMGEAMASMIDRGTKYVADPDTISYISRLAQKIVFHSDAEVPFQVKIIDSPDARVFALPGGFLYIDKGLIGELDNEAELTALMAHEIAHVAARHATRFATRKEAWNLVSVPIAWASGPAALGTSQIGPLSLKKFNRDAELEADLLGIEYQYAAGYDPNAFPEVLEKLSGRKNQDGTKASPVERSVSAQIARAFADYPSIDQRIQRLQTEITSFLPARTDYVIDTSEFQAMKAKLADRPVLRHSSSEDGPGRGPVLRRRLAGDMDHPINSVAGSQSVTNGQLSPVFSYLPALE